MPKGQIQHTLSLKSPTTTRERAGAFRLVPLILVV